MKIFITGASGFIGTALRKKLLAENHQVIGYTRDPEKQPKGGTVWTSSLSDLKHADAIVNLAGDSIFGYWTKEKKHRIYTSRIETTKALYETVKKLKKRPNVLINASAVGYYPSHPRNILTEHSHKGSGFLAKVTSDWEQQANAFKDLNLRVVCLRFAPVYSHLGGVLPLLIKQTQFFMGATFAQGKQWQPWIHLDDIVNMITTALSKEKWQGPINAVAPECYTQKALMQMLGKILNRPIVWNIPAFVLKLVNKEMAEEMFLASQRVKPQRLLELNYRYLKPDLAAAINRDLQ